MKGTTILYLNLDMLLKRERVPLLIWSFVEINLISFGKSCGFLYIFLQQWFQEFIYSWGNYSNFSFSIFKFSMEIHSMQQVLISMTIFLWQHGGWMVATMKSESKIFWMKSESKILWEHKGWMVATIHQIWFVQFCVHSLISITLNLLRYEQDLHIFKLISMIFNIHI